MTDRLALASRLLSLGLTLVLAAYSFVAHPLHLAAAIAAATLLLVIALTITRRVFARKPAKLPDLTGLFVMVVSATCTLHTLMAREVYDPVRFIDLTPGYRLIAWTLHGLVIASVILAGPKRSSLVALGATIVYTSSLYLPIFATPEMGASFVPFLALALALLATEIFTSRPVVFPLRISSLTPLVLLGFLALIASLFSHSQSESMTWFLKLLTLGLLMLTTPLVIRTRADWKRLALLVVTMSVAVPVLLSMAKLVELSWQLGAWAILEYKMGLAELGRANLIARTLLVGVPISVALATTATRRGWRMLWWALNALALAVFATCQSWGGMIALALTVAFAGILARGARWRGWWQSRVPGTARYLLYAAALIVVVAGFLGLIQLAPQTNVGSFNGRLFQFRAAIREMLDHPLLGVGPGHSYAKSRYTTGLDWLVGTQVTRDQPLIPVYHLRRSTILHHHNLYFEIGAGIGMLGLAAFAWFLVELLRLGLNTRRRMQGTDRHLLTGCLVAIFASAAWGLLDAMRVSPPFFTFPTWALAGLVLAAPRAFGVGERQRARGEDQRTKGGTQDRMFRHRPTLLTRMSSTKARVLGPAALLLVAVVAVLLPLGGNLHYRRGFSAYQEGKWDETVEALERASRWEPLNAKYHQMRGEALINLGRYDEAAAAYERAGNLKREFAPYHAQLGWLYWLAGDLAAATSEFEKAVEMDPREAWRDGLHADLGLAYAAQGRTATALPLLAETVKLDPQMAAAAYWLPGYDAAGHYEVALDPAYLAGLSPALEKRILAHLGRADHTARLFEPILAPESPLTLDQVLDSIEEEYERAREQNSREAPRLLATVADAARAAGLEGRAEGAYLAFQEAFPDSAYGFRDLGSLYREQGRMREALEQLKQAVRVSPRDTTSWLELARAYLAGGLPGEAEAALDRVYKLEPLQPGLYELRAQVYVQRAETGSAADELRKALVIEESVANRIALAGLYRKLGDPSQAAEQCTAALDAAARTWPRPLDPALREIASCLAQSAGSEVPEKVSKLVREQPAAGNVLLGHFHRACGGLDAALAAYEAAAEARPDEGGPHYFLGETYQALGQAGRAEAEYLRAAELDPLESLPLLALGRMQWAQGRQEEALDTYRGAVEATPGWGEAQIALGNALLALGDRESAAAHYRRAQLADRDVRQGLAYDFAAELAGAEIEAPGAEYVRNDYATLDGDRRRTLFTHPDSRVRYVVEVPQGGILSSAVATDPESWDQPGDGVTFRISVEAEGRSRQVFAIYIDPKHVEADHRWHPFSVDLSDYAGQRVTVVLETGSGPAGDNGYDWAHWGLPRLMAHHRGSDAAGR